MKQSQAFKYAQTLNSSRPAQRIKATAKFVLYIVDITSDILVGYDLYQKCHIMYSLVAFMILSLPGISEGLQMMKYGSGAGLQESFCTHLVSTCSGLETFQKYHLLG